MQWKIDSPSAFRRVSSSRAEERDCFELCAGFKHPAALQTPSLLLFILFAFLQIASVEVDKRGGLEFQSLQEMQEMIHKRGAVRGTKNICSCVILRCKEKLFGFRQTGMRHVPQLWASYGETGEASASLETAVQVDQGSENWLSAASLSGEPETTTPHFAPEERRMDLCCTGTASKTQPVLNLDSLNIYRLSSLCRQG